MKRLEELRKLLVVVDMINGFVKKGRTEEESKLADPYIQHIIKPIKGLVNKYLDEEGGIAFVCDNHKQGCREFDRYPEHCIEGTWEAEVIDELLSYKNYGLLYKKNSTCALWAPSFLEDIKKMKKLKRIDIVGCCTDICDLNFGLPLNNYFDETNRRVEIVIKEECVETFQIPGHDRKEWNEMAFKFMEQSGIKVRKIGGIKYDK
jgi:nicotinamidase-related amidase